MAVPGLSAKDLKAFDLAAAGHDGVLSDKSGSLIIKPCTPAEVSFYTTSIAQPRFRALMPTFFGTLELNDTPATEEKGHNRDTNIVLENITHPFVRPCVLDIKLGAQLWDNAASEEKRKRLDEVSYKTTSGSMGMRIAGMKVWKVQEDGEGDYKVYDKYYGRTFNKENVIEGLKEYFVSGIKKEHISLLVGRFLKKVREVREVLEATESRMYSASLLFVYEGDEKAFEVALNAEGRNETDEEDEEEDEDEEGEPKKKKVNELKLIDFAHASWTPGEGSDENALRGVRSVESLLEKLMGEA